jgi:hypothetical protein
MSVEMTTFFIFVVTYTRLNDIIMNSKGGLDAMQQEYPFEGILLIAM